MKRFLVPISLVLSAVFLIAQVTPPGYPFPKPLPTSGQPPSGLTLNNQSFAPTGYNQDSPIVWAVHVGGGLQSRSNSVDRLAIMYPIEGSMVYDASDQTWYAVNTNLQAVVPLFKMDGTWINDISIYSRDGTLSSNRMILGSGRTLTFTNLGLFEVRATLTNILSGLSEFQLQTPSISSQTATNGMILQLLDSTKGLVDFRPAPSTFSTNIYNTDGTISGLRTVNLGANTLSLTSTNFNSTLGLKSGATTIESLKLPLNLSSTGLVVNIPSATTVDTVLMLDNITSKEVKFKTLTVNPFSTNIYNTSGVLASDRTVEGNFNYLSLTNIGYLGLRGRTSVLSGQLELDVRTPNVFSGSSQSNRFLTLLDPVTGRSEFVTAPLNIYQGDGTITNSRTVTIPLNMYLRTIGAGDFILNSARNNLSASTNIIVSTDSLVMYAATSLGMRTPRWISGAAKVGDILTLTSTTDAFGATDFYTPTNIYNNNGTLTGPRTVTGGGNNMTFSGHNAFTASGTSFRAYASASGDMVLATPRIMGGVGGVPANGYVLTLKDNGTGRVEFESAPQAGTAVNIYNSDGALNTAGGALANGIRDVGIGAAANRLVFNGYGGGSFEFFNANRAFLYTSTNWILTKTGGELNIDSESSTVKWKFTTPRVKLNGAASMAGQVLTLAADGTTDFQVVGTPGVDTNIYNQNGTLNGDRTVTGNNKSLYFLGLNNATISGVTTAITGTTKVNVQTPDVYNLVPNKLWQYLQLQDTGGKVEFATITNIYNGNGTLTSDRTITANGKVFAVTGASTAYMSATADVGLYGSSRLILATPRVMGVGTTPQQGWALSLTNVGTGEAEYMPIVQQNIYNNNGSILPASSTRTVSLNSGTLQFQGPGNVQFNSVSSFSSTATGNSTLTSSGTTTIQGAGGLFLQTKSTDVPAQGDVLTRQVDGSVEYAPIGAVVADTLYSKNGVIAGDRDVTGGGYLKFGGPLTDYEVLSSGHMWLRGSMAVLRGSSAMYIQTPGTIGGVPINSVLTADTTDGKVEFRPIPAVKTIYTDDGTISGLRHVTVGSGSGVTFDGLGAFFVQSSQMPLRPTQHGDIITPDLYLAGTTKASFVTKSGGGALGKYLKMIASDGEVDYDTPVDTNLGNQNQTIPAITARTVTVPSGSSLSINGTGVTKIQNAATTVDLAAEGALGLYGKGGLFLKTRNWTTATPLNYVLKLSANGEAEWAQETGGTSGSGKVEYSATIDLNWDAANLRYNAAIVGGVISPTYTGSQTLPIDQSRWLFRIGAINNSGGVYNGGAIRLALPQASTTYFSLMRSGNIAGDVFTREEIVSGNVMEMVFMQSYGPNSGNHTYVSVNAGWAPPGQSQLGIIEYYGNTTGTFPAGSAALGTLSCGNADLNPKYTVSTEYPSFTRASLRYKGTLANANYQTIDLSIGTGPVKRLVGPDRKPVQCGDIPPGGIMELMYDRDAQALVYAGGADSAHGTGAWIMLNFGIGANGSGGCANPGLELTEEQKTRYGIKSITATTTSNVQTIANYGVIDTFAQLAQVPLTFKKVSTLGFAHIDDGGAEDYYLTGYDIKIATRRRGGVQSALDPTKMWKKLNK